MFGVVLAVAGAFGFDYYHNTKMNASSKKFSDRLAALNSRVNEQYDNVNKNLALEVQQEVLENENNYRLMAERVKTQSLETQLAACEEQNKDLQLVVDAQAAALERMTTAKPAGAKPAGAKPAEAKPAEAKPAEAKPAEAKPAEAKPAEAKPAEAKPAEAKPVPPATKPLNKKQRREAAKAKAAAKAAGK